MDVMLKWADMNITKPKTTSCPQDDNGNGNGNGGGTGAPGNGKGQGADNNNPNGHFTPRSDLSIGGSPRK